MARKTQVVAEVILQGIPYNTLQTIWRPNVYLVLIQTGLGLWRTSYAVLQGGVEIGLGLPVLGQLSWSVNVLLFISSEKATTSRNCPCVVHGFLQVSISAGSECTVVFCKLGQLNSISPAKKDKLIIIDWLDLAHNSSSLMLTSGSARFSVNAVATLLWLLLALTNLGSSDEEFKICLF